MPPRWIDARWHEAHRAPEGHEACSLVADPKEAWPDMSIPSAPAPVTLAVVAARCQGVVVAAQRGRLCERMTFPRPSRYFPPRSTSDRSRRSAGLSFGSLRESLLSPDSPAPAPIPRSTPSPHSVSRAAPLSSSTVTFDGATTREFHACHPRCVDAVNSAKGQAHARPLATNSRSEWATSSRPCRPCPRRHRRRAARACRRRSPRS